MKKILFLISNLKVGGGAEKSVSLIVNKLKHYDVEVLTFYNHPEEYSIKVKRSSFNYVYSNSIILKTLRQFLIFPFILKNFITKEKYSLIISNAEDANIVALFTKLFSNFPLWTVIRNNIYDNQQPYYYFRKMHKISDKIIVLTKALQLILPYPSTVVYNSVDKQELILQKNDAVDEKNLFEKNNILSVGRLVKQKNHKLLIDIIKNMPHINLIIIGEGPLKSYLKSYSKNIPNVFFLGSKSNVYAYIDKCDVFALPSTREGMPRVIMEALACGVTCIANDCNTGPRELLGIQLDKVINKFEKTKYGYLIPFNNKMEFVNAIQDFFMNHNKKHRNEEDRRFDIANIITIWESEIEKFHNSQS